MEHLKFITLERQELEAVRRVATMNINFYSKHRNKLESTGFSMFSVKFINNGFKNELSRLINVNKELVIRDHCE